MTPNKINRLIKKLIAIPKKKNKSVRPKNKCQLLENIYETNTFKKYDQILKEKKHVNNIS